MSEKLLVYKVVMAGDAAVGKTSLIKRHVTHTFNKEYLTTVGIQVSVKEYPFEDYTVKAMIWDIAGQQTCDKVHSLYFKDSDAGIFVYDITRPKPFQNIKMWYKKLQKNAPGAIAILCGNKKDLEWKRKVTFEEGQRLAKQINAKFFIETSALTGEGVDDLFEMLLEVLLLKKEKAVEL
ncbi:MAG: Rab family GTPase [Candidatus Asgardarchaeia archaeon]